MERFTTLTGIAAPMPLSNINTDMITPKHVMKAVTRKGLSWGLFCEYRFRPDGSENPDFILNREPWRHSKIIVALENFGCGSSREHSPWALFDYGIRSIIAVSFADIFYNNCTKNGIVPAPLKADEVARVMAEAEAGREVTVDLETQTVQLLDGSRFHFDINPFRKHCLLNGLDDIGVTLEQKDKMAAFETSQRAATPWLYDRPSLDRRAVRAA